MRRGATLDPDYGVFVAGPERTVLTWYAGAWVWVSARDIGRAPQPGYVGDGGACDGSVEKFEEVKRKRVGGRQRLPLDERIQRRIKTHFGSMQLKELANHIRMPVADLWSYLAERPETYVLTGKLGKRKPAPRVALRGRSELDD